MADSPLNSPSRNCSPTDNRVQPSESFVNDDSLVARNSPQSPSVFDPILARVATAYPGWRDAERRYRETFSPGCRSAQARAVKAAATAALKAELSGT
jgi:hypothetical protein